MVTKEGNATTLMEGFSFVQVCVVLAFVIKVTYYSYCW